MRLDLPVLRSWTDPFTVPSPLPSMNLLRNLAVRAARVAEVLAEARVIT